MVDVSDTAAQHDPSGDEEHIAHGQDYYFACSCGTTSMFRTDASSARQRGAAHETYCDGDVTIRVSHE